MKDENEMLICLNVCQNDMCEHNSYAAPIDGTEVRVGDMFGTDKCPYSGERGRKWEEECRRS